MKKLLILLPIVLFSGIGLYWITANSTNNSTKATLSTTVLPKSSQALFSFTEHNLHEMIRHGDEKSSSNINQSLNALSLELQNQKNKGLNVDKVEQMLLSYKQDLTLVCNKFSPRLQKLHKYSHFEEEKEKGYLASIEQIGLYELKTRYTNLDRIRQNYIKEPSQEGEIAYLSENKHLQEIIGELYLDSSIEKPLLEYLTNHKNYLNTVLASYNDSGIEQINRLRNNGYAIRAELQLLPES